MEMDPLPPPPVRATADRRRCREYLLALEEERRKIQVFQRELPLCLELVTQTIEEMRSQVDGGVGSEETVSDHGPVLEEFMPLKPSLSFSSSGEEHDSAAHDASAAAAAAKKEEAPFEKEKKRVDLPALSTTTAAASSAVIGNSGDKAPASVDTASTGTRRKLGN